MAAGYRGERIVADTRTLFGVCALCGAQRQSHKHIVSGQRGRSQAILSSWGLDEVKGLQVPESPQDDRKPHSLRPISGPGCLASRALTEGAG